MMELIRRTDDDVRGRPCRVLSRRRRIPVRASRVVGVPAGTAALQVQLAKRTDGGMVLRCTRADGSVTWQRQEGAQAAFFPLHDLTHFAVETTRGFAPGFFGLIADGWEILETTGKGARGALPAEALLVEHLVGFLDAERASGDAWSAAEYASQLANRGAVDAGLAPAWLTDDALNRVRARRRELFAAWRAVAPGYALELTFAPG